MYKAQRCTQIQFILWPKYQKHAIILISYVLIDWIEKKYVVTTQYYPLCTDIPLHRRVAICGLLFDLSSELKDVQTLFMA